MPRIACLFIPDFPLAAKLRAEPDFARRPLALLEGAGPASKVVAATASARRAGVEAGQTAPQARARLPSVAVLRRDAEAERAARQALLEVAEAFSPAVEEEEPGVAYLEVSGAKDERALGEAMIRRGRAALLEVQVGVASGRPAARAAAESAEGGPEVVAEGLDAAYLAPLPLERLRAWRGGSPAVPMFDGAAGKSADAGLLETLRRWGVRRAGELAGLEPAELERRLGKAAVILRRAASGADDRPLVPRLRPAEYREGVELEWEVSELGPFLELARGLLERLAARLESAGLAAARLELELKLDGGGADARGLDLAAPTVDLKTLVGLVGLELEARPPRAPVVGLGVAARPARPRLAQLSLFGRPAFAPDKIASTLARLSALLGPDRVGRPRAVDGHLPERSAVSRYLWEWRDDSPLSSPLVGEEAAEPRWGVSVRVVRPAVELEVALDEGGRPASVRSAALHVQGEVRVASGPWKLEEGWWRDEPAAREYWDLELTDGALYRVYREARSDRWFCDGVYD